MSGTKLIASNKKARHDFHVTDSMEAGLVLMGSEVKALRAGNCNLKDSYVSFRNGEAYLQNAHISPYGPSSYNNHDPERLRKLLLHKLELDRLEALVKEKGITIVPLRLYFKKGVVKIEIGLAKGKDRGDKRQDSKKRDAEREMASSLKKSR